MADNGPAHRVQSAAVEYGYPQGHLGHLTQDEETTLRNFKALCAEKGAYQPAKADKPASHDDATLLRFLRARRFNVNDSFQQFQDTEKWRKANDIDKLYETIDLKQYDDTRRLYPQWTGRRDRRGIPVYVFEVKHLNSKTMSAYEKSAANTVTEAKSDGSVPPKLLRLFALYENLTRFAMPLSTALPDRDNRRTPITQSNNIVDISGVGLKQFWNLRAHMQDASTLATAHYPETLDRIFIIGAPAFFPTVWSWIKKWFDPITTSKIFILSSSDMKKTLEAFIDVENIPKKYGGKLEFEFGDKGPTLDPILEKYFEWKTETKEYPVGPMYWKKTEQDGHGVMELISAGSENGIPRNGVIGILRTPNTEEDLMNLEPETVKSETNGTAKQSSLSLQVPGQAGKKEVNTVALASANEDPANTPAPIAVEAGEVVPASRPHLESYVTASEGLPLSPTYSGPVYDVPSTKPDIQEATEKELANGIDTPEEPTSPQITALKPINGDTKTVEEENVDSSPTSPSSRGRIGDLSDKLRNSFEGLGSKKREGSRAGAGAGSDGKSEKSLGSTKSLKDKIRDKLVK